MTLHRYPGPQTSLIEGLSFRHGGCTYQGTNGFLSWKPTEGFHIEAKVKLIEGRKPSVIEFQSGPYQPAVITVSMDLEWGVKAIAQDVPLVYDDMLLTSDRLAADVAAMRFESARERPTALPEWNGRATYSFRSPNHLLYVIPRTTLFPRTKAQQTEYLPAFEHKEDSGETFIGSVPSDGELEVHFALPKGRWSQDEAWAWPEALGWTLCLIYGTTAPLLWREMECDSHTRTEVKAKAPTRSVWFLNEMADFERHITYIQTLTAYFAKGGEHALTCRKMIAQINSAAGQGSNAAAELLLATIMEAVFRSVYNEPFRVGGADINLHNKKPDFIGRFLTDEWTEVCSYALEVQRRLRLRNAHPDWMGTDPTVKPWTSTDVRLADMQFLARFYRGLVMAFAGIKDAELRQLQLMLKNAPAEPEQDS